VPLTQRFSLWRPAISGSSVGIHRAARLERSFLILELGEDIELKVEALRRVLLGPTMPPVPR